MKVIFLHDVPRVGKKNEVKEVNGGYAMNFLLPKKLAVNATPQALADLEMKKKIVTVEKQVQEDLLIRNLEEIKDKVVTIKEKADEKGHLFSGVHTKEIVAAMKAEHHADIDEDFIVLEKPIKEIGEFEIPIEVKNKKSSFKLVIERA